LVLIDYDKCMGCKYCMVACPFMARHFNEAKKPPRGVPEMASGDERKGVVEKCDFCEDRLSGGDLPRCVEVCPYDARIFGNRDNPDSKVAKLLAQEKAEVLKPEGEYHSSVYYIGVK
jgi:molybdopterin-containing oxidoreductase family iron-sulfur binding subunit